MSKDWGLIVQRLGANRLGLIVQGASCLTFTMAVPVAVSILNVYIFLKNVIQRSVRLIWSAEKVKCKANRDNNSAKLTKYASCTSSR